MVDRATILSAIRERAEANGGVPLGRTRFERLTGIRESDWLGLYWARWGDALQEAGYEPNKMQRALDDETVLSALVPVVRELGRLPTDAELRLRRRTDRLFPSHGVFERLGGKRELAAWLLERSRKDSRLADVAAICEALVQERLPVLDEVGEDGRGLLRAGQVYLMKAGSHYKIGRSNAAGRRAYELAIQLPERLEVVHVLDTDDAVGIERYWHQRFASRRANGEWFALTSADVTAFKRRRHFM
ncbi:MAG: GIY-YIG nuclease family protein [Actinomycetota bacterium]|nr:GIY-YIG nuclease family protein [Actinomycetota bacterium]